MGAIDGVVNVSKTLLNPIGSIIGAGSGIIQGLIDARVAKKNTDRTNKANMELAKYAYSEEQKNWTRQNEYNSPKAQMERFKDAHLNPNLIYTRGNEGNASFIPKYQAPALSYNYHPRVNIPETISQYYSGRNQETGIKSWRQKFDAGNMSNKILNTKLKDAINTYLTEWGTDNNGPKAQSLIDALGLKSSDLGKSQESVNILKQQKALNQFQIDFLKNGGKYAPLLLELLKIVK
ncbi:MAG: DNA pilot protein [Microviridae sp.]|nr:MAG: DNA pilot protein [Microviridae sp.]